MKFRNDTVKNSINRRCLPILTYYPDILCFIRNTSSKSSIKAREALKWVTIKFKGKFYKSKYAWVLSLEMTVKLTRDIYRF